MKIVQILIAPDNSTYQGVIIGLDTEGHLYTAEATGWRKYFECKLENAEVSGE